MGGKGEDEWTTVQKPGHHPVTFLCGMNYRDRHTTPSSEELMSRTASEDPDDFLRNSFETTVDLSLLATQLPKYQHLFNNPVSVFNQNGSMIFQFKNKFKAVTSLMNAPEAELQQFWSFLMQALREAPGYVPRDYSGMEFVSAWKKPKRADVLPTCTHEFLPYRGTNGPDLNSRFLQFLRLVGFYKWQLTWFCDSATSDFRFDRLFNDTKVTQETLQKSYRALFDTLPQSWKRTGAGSYKYHGNQMGFSIFCPIGEAAAIRQMLERFLAVAGPELKPVEPNAILEISDFQAMQKISQSAHAQVATNPEFVVVENRTDRWDEFIDSVENISSIRVIALQESCSGYTAEQLLRLASCTNFHWVRIGGEHVLTFLNKNRTGLEETFRNVEEKLIVHYFVPPSAWKTEMNRKLSRFSYYADAWIAMLCERRHKEEEETEESAVLLTG